MDRGDATLLDVACKKKGTSLGLFLLLYNAWPEALRLRNEYGRLPIHQLCCNKYLDETASIDILWCMLEIDSNLPREVDEYGCLPIHHAVCYKSTAFGKILFDAYPESLQIRSDDGMLPIHDACSGKRDDTADTIQYMLELDPELINADDGDGWLPIHFAAQDGSTKSIEMLVKYDPDAASKETNDGNQQLPLHLACNYNTNLSSIQVLYDAYPEAVFTTTEHGETPLENARLNSKQSAVDFLQTQLVYARQAQDMTAMTTVDENGWLPLHHALKDNASLGSIKLLVRGNPAAVQVADQNGACPLHIACEFSSVKVVKYLVELAGDTLNNVDANKDSPLHYACREGNLGVVKYLLERNAPSVSDRNNEKKLPIHLLFECKKSKVDKECTEYIEVVWLFLLTYPEVVRDFMSY
jgi:ankyrin repeat protein